MKLLNGAYMVAAREQIGSLYTAPEVKLEIFDKLWKHITDLQHGYETEYHNGYSTGHKEGYEQGKRDAVVHGAWVYEGFDGRAMHTFHCEKCGHTIKGSHNIWKHYPFCNKCGAQLDEMVRSNGHKRRD